MEEVVEKLKKHYPLDTPVAIVRHAGYQDKEKVNLASLGTILDKTEDMDLDFEYMFYVGDFLANRYKDDK